MLGILTAGRLDLTVKNGMAIHKGKTWKRTLALTLTSSGAVVPLTGYTAFMNVRDDYGGAETVTVGVTVDADGGTITLEITAANTAAMVATSGVQEVKVVDGDSKVEGLIFGRVETIPEVPDP